MKKDKKSFIKLIRFFGIAFVLGIGFSIVTIEIISTYSDYNIRAQSMRNDYISHQKVLIKQEVMRVADEIYYQKAQSEVLTQEKIKSLVDEAYAIVENIYQKNKNTKSKAEIKKIILDALRPVRFEGGNGYYFITRFDGVEILFADKPEMEGVNLLNFQDSRGEYVIKDMIQIVEQHGEGFYEYHWTKPFVEGNNYKKISFVKRFKVFDWLIGAGLYVDDVESHIKTELLSNISRIRYGKEGYIFVNRFNGDALVSNGKVISEQKKLWEIFNKNPEKTKKIFDLEYDAALTKTGDYIYYSIIKLTNQNIASPKTSFIYGIPDWQWLIGSGVYLDDVEADIVSMQLGLVKQVERKVLKVVLLVLLVVCFFLFWFRRLNRMLENDLTLFALFFNNSVFSNEFLNREKIKFEELDRMAENANNMLEDRQRIEQELRLNDEQYRTLVSNIPGVSYRCVFEKNWTMASISKKIEDLTGYAVSDFISNKVRAYASIIHPDDKLVVKQTVKQRVLLKQPFIVEYRIIRSDGEIRWVFEKGKGLFDDDDQLVFIDGVLIDITDQKKAEEKMIEIQYFNQEIITKSPIGIAIYAEAGKCISANQSIADIVGATKDQVLSSDYDKITAWKRSGLYDMARTVLSENSARRKVVEINTSYGKHVVIDCQMVPLMSGQRNYFMLMATDMTEYRKMQDMVIQSEKMLSVGGLAAGMAHEINNPLSGMMQTAEVMKKRLTDPNVPANKTVAETIGVNLEDIREFMEQRSILRMLTTINDSGRRIAEIVNNMLTFSRKSEAQISSNDLTDLIDKTLELSATDYDFKKQYDFKNIVIVREYEKNLPLVACEGNKIQQVLLNLFRNGSQAMQRSSVENPLFIIRALFDSDKNMVVIEVEDNGPGMDDETCKKVFEPFFTTKAPGEGTGLGLSVSYFIITENHGGELSVESRQGEGTKFTIRLPVNSEN